MTFQEGGGSHADCSVALFQDSDQSNGPFDARDNSMSQRRAFVDDKFCRDVS